MPIPRFRVRTLMTVVAAGASVTGLLGGTAGILVGLFAPKVVIGLYALDGPGPPPTFGPVTWAAQQGVSLGLALGAAGGLFVCLLSQVVRRRPRFTTRRLMALVAVVGMLLGVHATIEARRTRLLRLADHHFEQIVEIPQTHRPGDRIDHSGRLLSDRELRMDEWHRRLWEKYRNAARQPWLPVPPDPPPPR